MLRQLNTTVNVLMAFEEVCVAFSLKREIVTTRSLNRRIDAQIFVILIQSSYTFSEFLVEFERFWLERLKL